MPIPVRTTTLLLNLVGSHAAPMRGAKPHWRPVMVVLLMPGGSVLVVAGDDEAALIRPQGSRGLTTGQRPSGRDVRVERGIEVEDVSVFLRQSAVPVVAEPGGKGQVGLDLELVLQEEPQADWPGNSGWRCPA